MRRCVFCNRQATLTAEHLWSVWMGNLLQDEKHVIRRQFAGEPAIRSWVTNSLDITARVVCEDCNGGWMSDLESRHAQPAMTDLILSDARQDLTQERVHSIAAFAFKTAVIGHAMDRGRSLSFPNLIFSRANLRKFSHSLTIPNGIHVWVGCFSSNDLRNGLFRISYGKTPPGIPNGFKLYACSFGIGRLIFQIVAAQWIKPRDRRTLIVPVFQQAAAWMPLSINIWPYVGRTLTWPPSRPIAPNDVVPFCIRFNHYRPPVACQVRTATSESA